MGFFSSLPEGIPLYEAVEKMVLGMGDIEIRVRKTQITFHAHRGFAWVWLPVRRMKNRPEKYIILSFGVGRRIESPRIVEAVEPYPGRWTHHVVIEKPSDIDEEIRGWLKEAYAFALSR